MNDPSARAAEMGSEALRAYDCVPASKPKLANRSNILHAIRGQKDGKALGPNCIPSTVLRHLPKRVITILIKDSKPVLRNQYFPSTMKHALVVSILKPWKNPTLPSSYKDQGTPPGTIFEN
jgi:hypothetical protein